MSLASPELATRILVIDDDTKLCRLVREYLAPFGFDIEAVHTGPEGIGAVSQDDFDAVILDVMLPGMSGYAVCDDNGCGTFLRASKFPYENAVQDITHSLDVREHEFAVLPQNPDRNGRANAHG